MVTQNSFHNLLSIAYLYFINLADNYSIKREAIIFIIYIIITV